MLERHPSHKRHVIPIAISLFGCLSLIILMPPSYAQVTNPSTGDTIAQYCSSGVCHTPGGPTTIITRNSSSLQAPPVTTPVGTVKLTQSCIGNNCNSIAHVQQLGKIGIQLSQVCLTDIKNNFNSSCLDYKALRLFDNTNPIYAGQWVDQPYFHRLAPKIKNHENFNPNPWVVMVDPNPDFTTNAKMIIVADKTFTWINQDEISNKGISMKTHVDRYVSPNCIEATVAPDYALIQDTIKYLESGCSITSYNDTKIIYQKEIPFSYDNPYSSLHYKAQVTMVKSTGGLGNCLENQCNIHDSYRKAGY